MDYEQMEIPFTDGEWAIHIPDAMPVPLGAEVGGGPGSEAPTWEQPSLFDETSDEPGVNGLSPVQEAYARNRSHELLEEFKERARRNGALPTDGDAPIGAPIV